MIQTFDTLSGIILIDKPAGMSSTWVDNKIKHKMKELLGVPLRKVPKIGHAGTLDPFATGVQIVGIGSATKDLHQLEQDSKTYQATIVLGANSSTDDRTGEISMCTNKDCELHALLNGTPQNESEIKRQIETKLEQFKGKQMQAPCSVSAKHIDGERAYKKELRGESVQLEPVEVEVYWLSLLGVRSGGPGCVEIDIELSVSKGTFIRGIARDLGKAFGCGGYVSQLRRTKIGDSFSVSDCVSLESTLAIEKLQDFDSKLEKYPLGTIVTIGCFDGVHLGHQKLIKKTVKLAKESRQTSLAIIIDAPQKNQLTTVEQRIGYINNLGVDEVITMKLDQIKDFEYPEFFDNLSKNLNMSHLVLTENSRFGKNCQGTSDNVIEYLTSKNVKTTLEYFVSKSDIIPLAASKSIDNERLSSSFIRTLIDAGDVVLANKFMGRVYKVSGKVVHGFERGRKLGFPTANLDDIKTLIPADGVYFGTILFHNANNKKERQPAMISVGSNPTFANSKRSVEVHIPSANGVGGESDRWYELYDQEVVISFDTKTRDMQKFDDIESLAKQLKYDSLITRAAWELMSDKIVIMPTDTVLGVCVKTRTDLLYQIKGRPSSKPIQTMIRDLQQARVIAELSPKALELANTKDTGWPGPLTLVVPVKDNSILGDHSTSTDENGETVYVGLRVPAPSPIADVLKITSPIRPTSANFSGESEFKTIEDAKRAFQKTLPKDLFDLMWFWDPSTPIPKPSGISSTVVKVEGDKTTVLRP